MVRHSVAGNAYGNVRIGAFMGKRMINEIRARTGRAAVNYLTEVSVNSSEAEYESEIPEEILGSEFLAKYKTHDDPVTTVQPDATYRVAGPTRHPIEENERVLQVLWMPSMRRPEEWRCWLSRPEKKCTPRTTVTRRIAISPRREVDFLVEAVRKRGAKEGLYGAKITGGGTGGTVAVFGRTRCVEEAHSADCGRISRRVGVMPDIFEGTSPGAIEFGARRYLFGASGWQRLEPR